jgi:oligopeptide transport system ATP-binding protein
VPLLEASDLRKSFPLSRNILGRVTETHEAVAGVSLTVERGETVAIVGESGAGKSTLGRMLLRLIEPDGGHVRLDGVDVLRLNKREMRAIRARMQMVFQDPFSSVDPRMTVGDSIEEPLRQLTKLGKDERLDRVESLLNRVGLDAEVGERFPRALSGGQLQRISVARAVATSPDLIVCDEPVASLDVSIRSQVLNLFREFQLESGLAYVFVSHDLSLVRLVAHRVIVMRAGRTVEEGSAAQIFEDPQHAYTKTLLGAVPIPDPLRRSRPIKPSA